MVTEKINKFYPKTSLDQDATDGVNTIMEIQNTKNKVDFLS